MAVYQRSFRPYDGPLTAGRWRFLIPARYALKDLIRSKLFIVFMTFCFVFPLLCTLAIYLRHNADLMEMMAAAGADIDDWMPIDKLFFGVFMRVQGTLAFLLVLFTGPRLVSRDLANNGLALYLCRPFSKTQYVAGKASVIALLVSLVTWVPGLLLWSLQVALEGSAWAAGNWRSAVALFVGSWVWIVILALLSLAVSAWVKWRPVAGFMLLLIYFGGAFFAQVVRVLFRSDWGHLFDLHHNIRRVWAELFDTSAPFFFSLPAVVSEGSVWLALALLVALSTWLLARRIRAYEVVS
jgi:ABC-2 type transport system permease protein